MAWIPSYGTANKETSEQFGTDQFSEFDRRDGVDQCAKSAHQKRPPTSRHVYWSQPSSPKRNRTSTGGCITTDIFSLDTRVFGDDCTFSKDDWNSSNTTGYTSDLSNHYSANSSINYSINYSGTNYLSNYTIAQTQGTQHQPVQQLPQDNFQVSQLCQQNQYQYQHANIQQESNSYMLPSQQQPFHQTQTTDDTLVRKSQQQQQRLQKTTEILKEGGLYDVAVKTASLIRQNQKSKQELEELRTQTQLFLTDVLNNPENRKVHQTLLNLQHQQNNPHLSAEKAVRDLFDQSNQGSVS